MSSALQKELKTSNNRMFHRLAILFFTLFFFPFLQAENSSQLSSNPISTGYFIKLILALVVVLGLVFFLAWAVKKFQYLPALGHGAIKVLNTRAIGQKDRLLLVQIGEEQLLLGVSSNGIQALHKLKEPLTFENEDVHSPPPFADQLKKMMSRREKTDV